jgi:ABC-type amino acid transport substrate-binding protein
MKARTLARIIALLLAIALWSPPPPLTAQESAPLLVAVLDFEPWAIKTGSDLDGIEPRLFRELARRIGRRVSLVQMPINRKDDSLEAARIDLIIRAVGPGTRRLGREIGEVGEHDVIIVAPQGAEFRAPTDLAGRTIAATRSRGSDVEVMQGLGAKSISVNSVESGMRMLMAGRVDAVLSSRPSIEWALRKMDLTWAALADPLHLGNFSLELCGRLDLDDATAQSLAEALAAMRADGTVARIFASFRA